MFWRYIQEPNFFGIKVRLVRVSVNRPLTRREYSITPPLFLTIRDVIQSYKLEEGGCIAFTSSERLAPSRPARAHPLLKWINRTFGPTGNYRGTAGTRLLYTIYRVCPLLSSIYIHSKVNGKPVDSYSPLYV